MALTTPVTTLASKATPRNGFGGASTVWPALSSSRITPANPDASAKAPWTRTTVGPGMGSPRGWRGDPDDITSQDPGESAQGCAAWHVTGSWRHGLRRTCRLGTGRSHRTRSTWPDQDRLPLPAVTHRYKRAHCLWLERFQIAEYSRGV